MRIVDFHLARVDHLPAQRAAAVVAQTCEALPADTVPVETDLERGPLVFRVALITDWASLRAQAGVELAIIEHLV